MISRDDADRRKDQHVDFGVAEKPEQMLPEQRIAAAGRSSQRHAADDEPAWEEEAGACEPIRQLQDCRRLQRGKREQQQQRRDQLRPDEERQPHERQAGRAKLHDCSDDVDAVQHRRHAKQEDAREPEVLPAASPGWRAADTRSIPNSRRRR